MNVVDVLHLEIYGEVKRPKVIESWTPKIDAGNMHSFTRKKPCQTEASQSGTLIFSRQRIGRALEEFPFGKPCKLTLICLPSNQPNPPKVNNGKL